MECILSLSKITKHLKPMVMHTSLKPSEYQWLSTFVCKVRCQIKAAHKNVFLSCSGLPMDFGAVSTQLASLWRKAGLNRNGLGRRRLCASILRQSAVTKCRTDGETNLQGVADIMGNSLLTAEKHYHLRNMKEAAGKNNNSIRKKICKKRVLVKRVMLLRRFYQKVH
ncbi:uncharacterized protein LOC105845906 isoform X2 [Hydra vulgaris]|uniref:uncharacterized protein LOC105845906 isoform X2 n=1 Tax=Hydra vulgaris TaxID=6087 RepID=UPI001F5F7601|nr:uncharacterized protein LOC105845906 isoform X2 [Hydra vulgaris]